MPSQVEFRKDASDWTVRDARDGDLPAIVAIYNETIAGRSVTADLDPVTVESRMDWFEAHRNTSLPIWVLSDANDGVLAWLSFDRFHARAAYAGTAMVALYVKAAHRRQGAGRHLLALAIRRAPALGLHTLLGYIFGHNQPSLTLFESRGFQRWAIFRAWR